MHTYRINEIFLTLQGEGYHTGRAAVFCRFAGCNLWTGRPQDRANAICRFCDTDFVGTDGLNGGIYTAETLVRQIVNCWPTSASMRERFVVCTGGEPLLQLDAALIEALHTERFTIAVETNGTVIPPEGIDWLCISPKIGSVLKLRHGHELKLVYPQENGDPAQFLDLPFEHFYLQPMDGPDATTNTQKAMKLLPGTPALAFESTNPQNSRHPLTLLKCANQDSLKPPGYGQDQEKYQSFTAQEGRTMAGVLPDWMIERDVKIVPFAPSQARPGVISYGVTSYGYDVRVDRNFKVFTNARCAVVDPKAFDPASFVDIVGDYCLIPPNSFALAETIEYLEIPRDVIAVCVGKSTYARCGIIVNVTPLEPEWRGRVTIEISNTTPLPAKVYANEGIAQMLFFRAEAVCHTSYADKKGKYQDQRGLQLPFVLANGKPE